MVRSPASEEPCRPIRARRCALCRGCGSERQDADEPEGEFTLEVVDASFPERQTTAQHSTMRISVRNTDDRDAARTSP